MIKKLHFYIDICKYRSFIYLRTPRMTVPTFPPCSLCWSSWYFCRLQFILFIIQFTEKLTVHCRQITISGKNFSLRTNGAYRSFHTGIDNWFPLITAFSALPPDIFPRLCIYFIRLQWQVLFWPLQSNFRMCCLPILYYVSNTDSLFYLLFCS